mmetsp:Transcript_79339/g.220719  ORF Transcript_79339/g.220719 Transcript_79339/m.220719 type:complete len:603 (-) Transcript_79339:40-1848(-)
MPATLQDIADAGLQLVELPGEGRCLSAVRSFVAGDVLLAERPMVRASGKDAAQDIARDPSRFGLLRGAQNLAAAKVAEPEYPFLLEVETNSFTFGGQTVVFNCFAMLNHACATSQEEKACFSILNCGDVAIDDRLEVKLVATRDISAGEPIRISYHEVFEDPIKKMERIQAHCGGQCGCSLCRFQGSERNVQQLGCVLSEAIMCQHCGEGTRPPRVGDRVAIERLTTAMYNGLHGRVLQTRRDGRALVLLFFEGVHKQMWLKANNLMPLEGVGVSLQKCGRCRSVYFCSRECQRAGWKDHRRFCSEDTASSWEQDYAVVLHMQQPFDDPAARQARPVEAVIAAFEAADHFVRKWTQPGRSSRPAPGHEAVQGLLLRSIPLGTLALWRLWSNKSVLDGGLWIRVAALAQLHLQHVRAMVPKFHIAHWTALHHLRGLLSIRDLQTQVDPVVARTAASLAAIFERQLDVARVFDPEAAANFKRGGTGQGPAPDLADTSRLFQLMASDPKKLKEFYSIDPALPMEEKMEQMALLLGPDCRGGEARPPAPLPLRPPHEGRRLPVQRAPQQKPSHQQHCDRREPDEQAVASNASAAAPNAPCGLSELD